MNLRVDDLKQLIDVCQTKFPDTPILWLRDLASYLNIKLVNKVPTILIVIVNYRVAFIIHYKTKVLKQAKMITLMRIVISRITL